MLIVLLCVGAEDGLVFRGMLVCVSGSVWFRLRAPGCRYGRVSHGLRVSCLQAGAMTRLTTMHVSKHAITVGTGTVAAPVDG